MNPVVDFVPGLILRNSPHSQQRFWTYARYMCVVHGRARLGGLLPEEDFNVVLADIYQHYSSISQDPLEMVSLFSALRLTPLSPIAAFTPPYLPLPLPRPLLTLPSPPPSSNAPLISAATCGIIMHDTVTNSGKMVAMAEHPRVGHGMRGIRFT